MDKIVYVHPEFTHKSVDIITPKDLDGLLTEGWEVREREHQKIGGIRVDVVHLYQSERGVTTTKKKGFLQRLFSRDDETPPPPERGVSVPAQDIASYLDRGGRRDLSTDMARGGASEGRGGLIPSPDGQGQLIRPPGVNVMSGVSGDVAFGYGVDAYFMKRGIDSCPFTTPGVARTQWLKGYNKAMTGDGKSPAPVPEGAKGPTDDAYFLGAQAAKGDKTAEVHCPYPPSTPHYDAWLKGFKENGGTIE